MLASRMSARCREQKPINLEQTLYIMWYTVPCLHYVLHLIINFKTLRLFPSEKPPVRVGTEVTEIPRIVFS